MAKFINSKKYEGVQYYIKETGVKSYYIRYRDETNTLKRVKIGDEEDGTTEVYCKNKRIEVLNALNKGEQPPKIVKHHRKDIIRLDDVATLYFASKEQTKSTIDRQSKYNKHIQPVLGKASVANIGKSNLEILKRQITDEKGLSPKTANMILELFSTIFNFGFKNEMYELINPATKVERYKIKNTRERYLRTYELEELYKEVKRVDSEKKYGNILELFVKLATTTGARMEGVLSIRKSDIDFDSDIIRITDFKKGGDIYSSYISSTTKEILIETLKHLNFNDYVISFNMDGEKVGARKLQTRLKPILDKLFNHGLEVSDRKNRIVLHSLRHTFASHLAVKGVPLKQIQELMNHSDIKETMKYAKLQDDANKKAMQSVF